MSDDLEWQTGSPPKDRPVVLLLKNGLSGRYSAVVSEFELAANGHYDQRGQPIYFVAWAPLPPFPKEER
jgi:hypothetical protein